MEQRVFRNVDI